VPTPHRGRSYFRPQELKTQALKGGGGKVRGASLRGGKMRGINARGSLQKVQGHRVGVNADLTLARALCCVLPLLTKHSGAHEDK